MNASLLLAIATLALVVGPLLERVGRRQPVVAALIDGATVGGILVVSLLHLMPEAAAHLGWWAPLLLVVGLVLPLVTERLPVTSWHGWRMTVGFLVLVLFVIHLLVEGAAIASTAADRRLALATVFVVAGHNLPLGALLWGHTERRFGAPWGLVVLGAVGAITWFGALIVPVNEGNFSAACSALLAGGLLHLVLQHEVHTGSPESRRLRNFWSGLGATLAIVLLVVYLGGGDAAAAGAGHDHDSDLPSRFAELFLETAPPLLLGVVGASLIEAFLPLGVGSWIKRGSPLGQSLRGVVIGSPMPVCSCGVLPIYRSLIVRRVPATAALSLLIAAPEIGIDSVLLSLPLLGTQATLARVLCAFALALVVGWVVGRRIDVRSARVESAHDHDEPRASGWSAVRNGLLETWGHLGPWILVGLFATAFFEPWLSPEWPRSMAPWVQIVALSLIGMPTYICATAATPLAALLLAQGFSPGAVVAFLLTGPATNLTTFGALRRLHSGAVAVAFVAVALGTTFFLGLCVNFVVPSVPLSAWASGGEHSHGPLHWICAAILLGLTLWVLFREGPRQFLAQLNPEGAEHHHHHEPQQPGEGVPESA